jgi:AcrR family transcriptional regulator
MGMLPFTFYFSFTSYMLKYSQSECQFIRIDMMSNIDNVSINRAERRRQHTREQLKLAAAEELMHVGYRNVTIKSITERADVGYGTFYLHFKDKDEIVWAVTHEIANIWYGRVLERLEGVPFPRREYLSWVYLFEYADSVRDEFAAMFGSGGSVALLQYYQTYVADLHEYNLKTGVYSSALDVPPEFLAQYMAGALVRLLIWWVETPNNYTPAQMTDMLYETAYRQPPPKVE